ncbi:hypothetical protein GCM10007913_42250 [Devosia yakushimensis]|uniref:Nudix hydrolase domain-containing protein n=1 Tax=Devosia yakushimensis TaxID=470028 RepID=A0ABQ5UJS8_9HYPH|nr:NUDIX domain-containing protein [Devosia yakushimensis]GLQ12292.1 hypothetical protein GCM10007913_42250 [Devosia yakushimensis]
MAHRISAGALVLREEKILLVRHHRTGRHDFWVGPGGGVEGGETLEATAERETLEESGVTIKVRRLAYLDELWSDTEIDVTANPAESESIIEANWFARDQLPSGHLFPEPLRDRFWSDLQTGFAAPIKLPLRRLHF